MPISIDTATGWSEPIAYTISAGDPYSDSSYRTHGATWFQRSWWNHDRWARKYVNMNSIPVHLTQMQFLACAGHSNGLRYNGGGGLVGPSIGCGCTFVVDLYVNEEGGARESVTSISSCTLEPINQYNCYYGGYGKVSTTNDQTSFGSTTFFGPGTGRDLDSNGHRKYRYENIFTFQDAPTIPPGGTMYVHVRPTNWSSGSTDSNSLIVLQSKDPFFQANLEPVKQPYIWRFNGTSWEKVLYAFKYINGRWEELSDDGS